VPRTFAARRNGDEEWENNRNRALHHDQYDPAQRREVPARPDCPIGGRHRQHRAADPGARGRTPRRSANSISFGFPLSPIERVFDIALLVARDVHRPVGVERAHESQARFLHHAA